MNARSLRRALLAAVLVSAASSPAHASGAAGLVEGLAYVLLVAPLGGLTVLGCVVAAVLLRTPRGPRGRGAARFVAALAGLVGVLAVGAGFYLGATGTTWLDWPLIYLASGLVPCASGAFVWRAAGRSTS